MNSSDTAPAAPIYATLLPGDRLPSMRAPCAGIESFAFDVFAGRYHLYGFFLQAGPPEIRQALETIRRRRDLFDDVRCSFTGVGIEPQDRDVHGLKDELPGVRFAWDFEQTMSQACGAVPQNAVRGQPLVVQRCWLVVDPSLHVLRVFPMKTTRVEQVLAFLESLPPPDRFGGVDRPAPVLMLPNVFEPELCRRLLDLHRADGGRESGLQRGGPVHDASFKRRRDYFITDAALIDRIKRRIVRRVTPELVSLFHMKPQYIERHIVGCYAAEDGGHFAPHIDNGPGPTAHRRFAVSVNLTDDFDGGDVYFPEFSMQGCKAPAGWAVVFPCGILHGVRRVTRGARYAYLSFVFDEDGRRIRDAELARVAAETASGLAPPGATAATSSAS